MKTAPLFKYLTLFTGIVIVLCIFGADSKSARADVVSFMVDPVAFDTNPADGFITGNEFNPVGSGGTVFSMTPTDNLTGDDRFQLSDAEGLRFGGGGSSTLSFDFSVNEDIILNSYSLGSGFFNNDPLFDIREGALVLSSSNSSLAGAGSVNSFQGGPIELDAGTNYSFVVTSASAATQSYLGSLDYTVSAVPEPSVMTAMAAGAALIGMRRRRRRVKN